MYKEIISSVVYFKLAGQVSPRISSVFLSHPYLTNPASNIRIGPKSGLVVRMNYWPIVAQEVTYD